VVAALCAPDLSALLQREAARGVHRALDLACLPPLPQVVVASLLSDERLVLAPVRLVLAVARPHGVMMVAGRTCTPRLTCSPKQCRSSAKW
jgi:hypothetical protein